MDWKSTLIAQRLTFLAAALVASLAATAAPYQYSTPVPPGIAAPKEMPTRFGTLKFFDGVPDPASTQKIFDNLDFQRAVQGYLLGLPAVNQLSNRINILKMGPANTTLPVILVGDLNSDAYGNDGTTAYGMLTRSFTDAWSVARPKDAGLTWGHDPLLADPTVEFVWRLDLILFRGAQFQALEMWRLSPQFQTTPPLWPSDHAGVLAHLRIK